MSDNAKRISVLIAEDQYERLTKAQINVSALIRDLLEDYFSETKITLSVNRKTRDLYEKIVSNTGATDKDIEPLLTQVLKELLNVRLEQIKSLKSEFE
ncbi:hypothetical protein [Bdellovibrio sp. HCB337]|uniref:hypothetical protein n=1 Tax=Bdellovibrio sp. HCB337 TaxID=3394358 RepID=UPI0039A45C4F